MCQWLNNIALWPWWWGFFLLFMTEHCGWTLQQALYLVLFFLETKTYFAVTVTDIIRCMLLGLSEPPKTSGWWMCVYHQTANIYADISLGLKSLQSSRPLPPLVLSSSHHLPPHVCVCVCVSACPITQTGTPNAFSTDASIFDGSIATTASCQPSFTFHCSDGDSFVLSDFFSSSNLSFKCSILIRQAVSMHFLLQ